MKWKFRAVLFATGASLVTTVAASLPAIAAPILGPVTYETTFLFNGGSASTVNDPSGSQSSSLSLNGTTGSASFTSSLSPEPSLTTQATVTVPNGGGVLQSFVTSNLQYDFYSDGGSTGATSVDVHVHASGSGSFAIDPPTNGGTSATQVFRVITPSAARLVDQTYGQTDITGGSGWTFDADLLNLSTYTLYHVYIQTDASVTFGLEGTQTTTSVLDPDFTVISGDEHLFFSDGIGAAATVGAPGPIAGAGLPGLLAGFGAMLAWYRRRRAAA